VRAHLHLFSFINESSCQTHLNALSDPCSRWSASSSSSLNSRPMLDLYINALDIHQQNVTMYFGMSHQPFNYPKWFLGNCCSLSTISVTSHTLVSPAMREQETKKAFGYGWSLDEFFRTEDSKVRDPWRYMAFCSRTNYYVLYSMDPLGASRTSITIEERFIWARNEESSMYLHEKRQDSGTGASVSFTWLRKWKDPYWLINRIWDPSDCYWNEFHIPVLPTEYDASSSISSTSLPS